MAGAQEVIMIFHCQDVSLALCVLMCTFKALQLTAPASGRERREREEEGEKGEGRERRREREEEGERESEHKQPRAGKEKTGRR